MNFDRAAARSLAVADFGQSTARCPLSPQYKQRPFCMQRSCSSLVSFPLMSKWGLGVGRGGIEVLGIVGVAGVVSGSGRELMAGVGVKGVGHGLGNES